MARIFLAAFAIMASSFFPGCNHDTLIQPPDCIPIIVTAPVPGAIVSSPLVIEGKVRGYWFFENEFSIKLVGPRGDTLGFTIATGQGRLTEDYVPFSVEMTALQPQKPIAASLIFIRNNPADPGEGLSAEEFVLPVILK